MGASGIDTLMTDIDTVYLKNPFEYFYEKHLGEKRLFMQGMPLLLSMFLLVTMHRK